MRPVKSITCAADPELGTQSHVDSDSPYSDTVSVSDFFCFSSVVMTTLLTTRPTSSSILPEEVWDGLTGGGPLGASNSSPNPNESKRDAALEEEPDSGLKYDVEEDAESTFS
jgi:hypothetical protein